MAEPLIWYATPASGASYRKHLLGDRTGWPNTRLALCGEARKVWEPAEDFARPEVFTICPGCARAASIPADDDPEDGSNG